MSSDDGLRTFIFERMNVAAEEIFKVFEQKMDGSEAELQYQRRLLESAWRPELRSHLKEGPQPAVSEEGEVQARSSSLEQQDSRPPPVKEEEQACRGEGGEGQTVKLESDTFVVTAVQEEDHQRGGQILDLNPDGKPEVEGLEGTRF